MAGGAALGGAGSATAAAVTVANAGVLDFSQNSGSTFVVSSLTFSNAATIKIGNVADYTSAAAIDVAGSNGLTVSGGNLTVSLVLSGLAPTVSGAIELIQYGGAIQGTGSTAFALNTAGITMPARGTPQFSPGLHDRFYHPEL